MDHLHYDRPMVGARLPNGYQVYRLVTNDGIRYRTRRPGWMSPVTYTAVDAINHAWDHYYVVHGAKPRLRVTKYGYTDVLTGHSVTRTDVMRGGTFAGAFRLRAERMRHSADASLFQPLTDNMNNIADIFEEIAQRLEVQHDLSDSALQ